MRRCMLLCVSTVALALGAVAGSFAGPPQIKKATHVDQAPWMRTATPVVVISTTDSPTEISPATGCDDCAPRTKLGARISGHFSRPRPAEDCLNCGTWRCEWKNLWSGCREFFDEGRFAPPLPALPVQP